VVRFMKLVSSVKSSNAPAPLEKISEKEGLVKGNSHVENRMPLNLAERSPDSPNISSEVSEGTARCSEALQNVQPFLFKRAARVGTKPGNSKVHEGESKKRRGTNEYLRRPRLQISWRSDTMGRALGRYRAGHFGILEVKTLW